MGSLIVGAMMTMIDWDVVDHCFFSYVYCVSECLSVDVA